LRQELEESHAGLARSLEENRSMRQHLDRILESLPCGVVVVSASGEITRLNPEGRRLLLSPPDISQPDLTHSHLHHDNMSHDDVSHGDVSHNDVVQHAEAAAAPGALADLGGDLRALLRLARTDTGEREHQIFSASGRGRWLAVRHAALAAEGGDSSVFILQDISGRKRLEQQQARHRREQALAEMSAVLAHEVRNPLGSLELFASLLAEAGLGAECQEWIAHLQHGLRTLAATVNNILHFHGAPSPQRTPVDLGQMLDWAASFLAPLARRDAVQVILRNALHRVVFAGDRHQLEQVLLNLSLNALRVMPDGGCLELRGAISRDGIGGASFAAITVADTGPGIAVENLEQIFEAGFSTRAGSPGLGLAVCRKIVEQHEGTIQVSSREGAGAIFTVRFALAETAAAERCHESLLRQSQSVENQVAS
jgi:two-component system, sensor histidine kinase FlrB